MERLKPFLYGVLIGSVAPAAAVVLSNGSLRSAFCAGVAFALCGCLAFAGPARALQWLDKKSAIDPAKRRARAARGTDGDKLNGHAPESHKETVKSAVRLTNPAQSSAVLDSPHVSSKRIVGSTRATLAPEEASMSGSAPQKFSVRIPGIHTDLTELFRLVNFEVRANPSPAKELLGTAAAAGLEIDPAPIPETPNSSNARRTAHKRTPEATQKPDREVETALRNLGSDRATARAIATRLAGAPGDIQDRLRLAIALAREAA